MLTRESVTFQDADGWSWEFDLTFMLSNYRCIWGHGCPIPGSSAPPAAAASRASKIYQGDGDARFWNCSRRSVDASGS